ncbi:PH domain-containing protein [Cnuibacter physcomitrellae]|nr:PH domain-containing protein [Cnuibacter physcomitrellae]
MGLNREGETEWHRTSTIYMAVIVINTTVVWSAIALVGALLITGILQPEQGQQVPELVRSTAVVIVIMTTVAVMGLITSLLRARSIRYRVGATEIDFTSGFFSRTTTSLPYDRIQTVSIQAGIVSRAFGLSSLVLQSAADQSSVTIPGLTMEQVNSVSEAVLRRVRRLQDHGSPLL